MVYADYYFYVNEFFGKIITAEEFQHLAVLASKYIDYITMGKAKKYDADNSVKMACCAIAELYAISEANKSAEPEKKSESVGSWSATYYSFAESKDSLDATILSTARQYLVPTGLLYRGRC